MTSTDIYPQESLNEIDDVELIDTVGDLPPATNGTRDLKDDTLYLFTDIVEDNAGRLVLDSNSVISGFWPSKSGYISTGGGPAVKSFCCPVYIDRMFLYAPGGQLFDLTGTISDELFMNKVTATDPTDIGGANIADLGTIDGYRVPTFDGCNFEHFDAGLTFTGASEKISLNFCPFRNVPSGVTCVSLDNAADTDILKLTGSYFKNFSDNTTQAVYADPSATISNIMKYDNIDHDSTVAEDSILNGQLGRDLVGVIVKDSYPLADSTVFGSIQWSGTATVTGSSAQPTKVIVPTTEFGNNERTDSPSDGELRYLGRPNSNTRPTAQLTISGVNSIVETRIAVNDTPLQELPVTTTLQSAANSETVNVSGNRELKTNDTISVFVENVGGTTDVDIESLSINI